MEEFSEQKKKDLTECIDFKDANQERIKGKLEEFHKEDWHFITSYKEIGDEEMSYPFGKKKRNKNLANFEMLFSLFFPETIWTFIMEKWDTRKEDASSTGNSTRLGKVPNKSTKKSLSHFKETKEVRTMFGCLVLMILTEKSNKRKAYDEVKKEHEDLALPSWNKIENQLHFLRFEDDEFISFGNMVSALVHKFYSPGKWIAVDESIIPDLSKNIKSNKSKRKIEEERFVEKLSDDKAPLVDMPSKPHPKGILIYGLVSQTRNKSLPIFWSMDIIFNPQDRSPMEAMYRLVDSWPIDVKHPVLVADAAFGSFGSLEILTQKKWDAVLSIRQTYSGAAGYLILHNNKKNGVLSVRNKRGVVLSIKRHNSNSQNKRVKMVITNACHDVTKKKNPQIDEIISQNENEVSIEKPTELKGNYSQDTLMELNGKELQKICKMHQIPKKGRKEDLANRIIVWLTKGEIHSQYKKLYDFISTFETKKFGKLHKIYYDNFNSQDLFNRELLNSLPHWTMKSWRNKLTIAAIMIHLLNAFAIFSEESDDFEITKNDFLKKAALHFLKK